MSPRRDPATPPVLEGHTFVRLLGSGGFADVFLYERELPRMPVAVKVLLASALTGEDRRRFTQEANVMARFFSHPYIVGILNAAVSADGRPYIVMQYYPKDNLWMRARRAPISVTEALQTGIQIASAVETAHRAGVIHRDIKPANVLTSEFGDPGLTDFGISATKGAAGGDEEGGLSIPWSPPEAFDSDASLDERSDVYSLGATIYTVLTGRSPFEVAGGANAAIDLMQRIERDPLRTTGRADVPASLERVLSQAMAKQPDQRHPSALALARDLQSVEQELHLKMTAVVVPDDVEEPARGPDEGGAGETRGRAPRLIDPTARPEPSLPTGRRATPAVSAEAGPPAAPTTRRPATPGEAAARTDGSGADRPAATEGAAPVGVRGADRTGSEDLAGTRRRIVPAEPELADAGATTGSAQEGRRRLGPKVVAAVVVAALVAVVLAIVLTGGGASSGGSTGTTSTTAPISTGGIVPTPTGVSVAVNGSQVTVTWADPDRQPGDYFTVLETLAGQQLAPQQTQQTSVTVTPGGTGQFCAQVELVRQDGQASSPSAASCTP